MTTTEPGRAQRFRKKPVVIEAIQFNGWNHEELEGWSGNAVRNAKPWKDGYPFMDVDTAEGTMLVSLNDWVIKGVAGEFYPCKPAIFEATYEPVAAVVSLLEKDSHQ